MKKILPFNIEAIKNGAKCVVIPDEVTDIKDYDSERYPIQIKHNGYTRTFTKDGWEYAEQIGCRLAILDESVTEQEGPKESFWMLLDIGEDAIPTDEFLDRGEWHPNGEHHKVTKAHLPIRRLVTIPSPFSPWVRYEDRKPEYRDGDDCGNVLFKREGATGMVENWNGDWTNKEGLFWRSINEPLPKPKRDFQREFVEKLESWGSAGLWPLLDDEMKAKVKAKWEAENP